MSANAELQLRLRAQTAELALAESQELIAELHAQLSRANAAAVRMARRAVVAKRVAA